MIYGVDLPTEVSYAYRMPSEDSAQTQAQTQAQAQAPLLEELLIEDSAHCGTALLTALTGAAPSSSKEREREKERDSSCRGGDPAGGTTAMRQAINPLNAHAHHSHRKSHKTDSSAGRSSSSSSSSNAVALSNEAAARLTSSSSSSIDEASLHDLSISIEEIGVKKAALGATYHRRSYGSKDEDYEDDEQEREDEAIFSQNLEQIDETLLVVDETSSPPFSAQSSYPIQCSAEIHSFLQQGRAKGTKFIVRNSSFTHSGDNTVPYVSLAYAKTFLSDDYLKYLKATPPLAGQSAQSSHERSFFTGIQQWLQALWHVIASNAQKMEIPLENDDSSKRFYEFVPPTVHFAKHVLDNWSQNNKVLTPSIEIFTSIHKNDDTTVVMEVSGVDHLHITKNSFVHSKTFLYLLPKMEKELCLQQKNSTSKCVLYYEQEKLPASQQSSKANEVVSSSSSSPSTNSGVPGPSSRGGSSGAGGDSGNSNNGNSSSGSNPLTALWEELMKLLPPNK